MRPDEPSFPASLLPRYEFIRLIKSGAQGHIFQARDTMMDRIVAIKVQESQSTLKDLQRFQLEARAVSKLKHRNILAVHDFLLDSGSKACLIMEFIDGKDMSAYLKQREEVDLKENLRILYEISLGMQHAHEHGILHRDLKPANILLQDPTHDDYVKIADFGLARSIDDQFATGDSGRMVGTPAYMSPEQAQGAELDERSDIYSFGCMAFELLASFRPFDAPSIPEVVIKQLNQPPPDLPEVCPNERAQAKLSQLIGKCLEKNPANRFSSFKTINEELQAVYSSLSEPEAIFVEDEKKVEPPELKPLRPIQMAIIVVVLLLIPAISLTLFFNNVFEKRKDNQKVSDNVSPPITKTPDTASKNEAPKEVDEATTTMDEWAESGEGKQREQYALPDLNLMVYNWRSTIHPSDADLKEILERDQVKYLHMKGYLSSEIAELMNKEQLQGMLYYPDYNAGTEVRTTFYEHKMTDVSDFPKTEEEAHQQMRHKFDEFHEKLKSYDFSDHLAAIKSLKILKLVEPQMTPERMIKILKPLKNLEVLYVETQWLDNETIETIATLPKLHSLYITPSVAIADNGLAKLANHAPFKRLLLGMPMTSSSGMIAFLKKQKEIEFLALPGGMVDDQLIKFIPSTKIRKLGLGRTNVTFEMLKPLQDCKQLELLGLIDCTGITDKDVEKLHKILPENCKIRGPK